ncbi:MAG: hypothetical protein DDT19_00265 [Syntrophomonadaceae bacterium]|nr:hypothetical protein [Bacillota bacterium]
MNISRLEVIVVSDVLVNNERIQACQDVFDNDLVKKELRHADREKMLCLHLNGKHQIISYEIVSIGTLSSSLAHPREIFKAAILANAYAILLVHNHPSGDPNPSQEDTKVTERIKNCGEILGINLVDHVIVTAGGYYSFREHGLL